MAEPLLTSDLHKHPVERRPRRKKRIPPAPKEIVAIRCSDKRGNEKWTPERARDLANFPTPFRAVILGPPNKGKSTLAKNIILHQRPRFQEVYVVHEDSQYSGEWDDLEPTAKFAEIPPLEFWCELDDSGPYVKRCVVLDDLEYVSACKERLKNLCILMRYASSHKGISIIAAHQSWFDFPKIAKKMSNVLIVYKPTARDELAMIENRCGLPIHTMQEIFASLAPGFYDSLTVDLTKDSPAPLRVNLFQRVEPAQVEAIEAITHLQGHHPAHPRTRQTRPPPAQEEQDASV